MKYQHTKLENAPRVPFNIDGRKLFASEKLEVVHLTLHPGEKMDPHSNPVDVVFFIIEGAGELAIGGDSLAVSVNQSIFVRAGILRGWKNTGTGPLRILVIKDMI